MDRPEVRQQRIKRRPVANPPFIQVSKQDCGLHDRVRRFQKRMRLLRPRPTQQAKVCCDYPQHYTADFQIDD